MVKSSWLRQPWGGAAVLFLFLGLVEAYFHSDAFLWRYRSVFAVGRAMDKLRFVEMQAPAMLIVGNSRVDNAFDPTAIQPRLPSIQAGQVFNLGLPGADARVLHALLMRLSIQKLLGPERIAWVVIGLDESFVQAGDTLGYGVFFSDRRAMLEEAEYRDLLRSIVRLWGFADHLKELREPGKLERFMRASFSDIDPVGGGAASHLGYRAGFGDQQDIGQISLHEAGSKKPPSPTLIRYLERCFDLLHREGVKVAVVFPPLLNREVLYLAHSDAAATPYVKIAHQLAARGIPMISLDPGTSREPHEFVNAGHLNDRGAQRYSRLLAEQLGAVWATPAVGAIQ